MDFIDVAYSFLILLSLTGIIFTKKERKGYWLNIMAVANTALLFYSVFVARRLYALYQFIRQFATGGHHSLFSAIGWFEIRLALIILLPFVFLIKRLSANGWITLLMFVLLNWSRYQVWLSSGRDSMFYWDVYYNPVKLGFKILNYLSLLVGGYALLWLLKRLPTQQVNN